MRTTATAGLAVSVLFGTAIPSISARAQDSGDVVAYLALIFTPPAGFAPVITRTMLGDAQPRTDIALRYGRVDLFEDATNNFALTWMRGGGWGSFGVTAGYWNPDCDGDGCDGHFVAGLGGDLRLAASSVGTAPSAMLFTVGLSGEVGFGKREDATIWSAMAGLPLALVAGSGAGLRIAPFLTPAFGFGYITGGGDSQSGTRPMLGGGIAIKAQSGFGATAGFQKVFIEDSRTTFGINVSLQI